MPLYVVEREYVEGPALDPGLPASLLESELEHTVDIGVTWLHSYVSDGRRKTFCVFGGPSPEAVRRVATRNRLSIERITEVRVLDPYFYPTEARRAQ